MADEIEIRNGKTIAMDTLRHIIRGILGLKPMEKEGVLRDTDEIDTFDEHLTASMDSAPACQLYHIDESGFQP
jgi:hypothetical protein